MPELDYGRLIRVLREERETETPVLLPDFFLDHFVTADGFSDFTTRLQRLANQGGGNLTGTSQLVRRGGNSVNTASALFSLGLQPILIVKTDAQGARLLHEMTDPGLDLSHVRTDGRLSSTVSIEVDHGGRRVNLMVSDSGSAADFSFSDLRETDKDAIRDSGLVGLLCLNHNLGAPSLAQDVFSFVRNESNALTFMDMGDPSSNPAIVEPLALKVLAKDLVDVLGANENEICWFASALSGDKEWLEAIDRPEDWLSAAQMVSETAGVRVDIHTPYYAATVEEGNMVGIPVFEVESQVICGAGDAWNAGNIYGELLGLDNQSRIALANAVAALYVSSPDASHPSQSALMEFLESTPSLSERGKKLLMSP
ncbi:carbohydrate kinase family protein [Candidatus Thorarchaeota archaeon]|nr:MAG: carbohydrate kinase family protein [Candidatus Thorarchaeota archaeon]